jgi:hypothetical protein
MGIAMAPTNFFPDFVKFDLEKKYSNWELQFISEYEIPKISYLHQNTLI